MHSVARYVYVVYKHTVYNHIMVIYSLKSGDLLIKFVVQIIST